MPNSAWVARFERVKQMLSRPKASPKSSASQKLSIAPTRSGSVYRALVSTLSSHRETSCKASDSLERWLSCSRPFGSLQMPQFAS